MVHGFLLTSLQVLHLEKDLSLLVGCCSDKVAISLNVKESVRPTPSVNALFVAFGVQFFKNVMLQSRLRAHPM
jgi:hypothetical protein